MFNNDHIDALIAREIAGGLTAAEKAELEAWLQEAPANRAYYEAMRQTWDLTANAYDNMPEPDIASNWERFQEKMTAPSPLRVVVKRRNTWRLAAAAIVVIAVAGLVFTLLRQNSSTTVVTADNDKKEITLPDGSRVFLNRNSEIRYDEGFASKHRTLKLKGEAFFDVQPNADHPFTVDAGTSHTKVLGTSFVIKAYENKPVQLRVVTGTVAFSGSRHTQDALVLSAGSGAILQHDKAPQAVKEADPNFLAWKENHLVFNHVPLYKTLHTLEDYFNVKFVVADSSLLNIDFYASGFDNPRLQEVLNVIMVAANVKITEERKGVYTVSR